MLALLGLCSAAFTPSALPAMPPSSTTTACVAQQQRRQAVMITPKGNSDPNFDPDAVDPEAVRRTVIKTGAVWAVVGSVAALVASSGKEFNKDNAPGPTPACHKSIQGQRALPRSSSSSSLAHIAPDMVPLSHSKPALTSLSPPAGMLKWPRGRLRKRRPPWTRTRLVSTSSRPKRLPASMRRRQSPGNERHEVSEVSAEKARPCRDLEGAGLES